MNPDLSVSKTIRVNAGLDQVWNTLTDPTLIKKYLYGTDTVTDWQPGSTIVFQGEYEGQTYKDHGVIVENIPKSKLSYSYWSGFSGVEDKPENYSTITYLLEDKGNNQTEFSWIQKGYATEAAYQHSKTGMDEFMDGIKVIMER